MGLSGGVRLGKELGATTQNISERAPSVKDQDARSEPLCLGEDQSDLTAAWRHDAGEKYIDRGIIPYWSDSFGDFARDQGLGAVFPSISLPSNAQKVRQNAPLARLQVPAAIVSVDGILAQSRDV